MMHHSNSFFEFLKCFKWKPFLICLITNFGIIFNLLIINCDTNNKFGEENATSSLNSNLKYSEYFSLLPPRMLSMRSLASTESIRTERIIETPRHYSKDRIYGLSDVCILDFFKSVFFTSTDDVLTFSSYFDHLTAGMQLQKLIQIAGFPILASSDKKKLFAISSDWINQILDDFSQKMNKPLRRDSVEKYKKAWSIITKFVLSKFDYIPIQQFLFDRTLMEFNRLLKVFFHDEDFVQYFSKLNPDAAYEIAKISTFKNVLPTLPSHIIEYFDELGEETWDTLSIIFDRLDLNVRADLVKDLKKNWSKFLVDSFLIQGLHRQMNITDPEDFKHFVEKGIRKKVLDIALKAIINLCKSASYHLELAIFDERIFEIKDWDELEQLRSTIDSKANDLPLNTTQISE